MSRPTSRHTGRRVLDPVVVWRLVRKDLHLFRLPLVGLSGVIPLLGLGVAVLGNQGWGFMGLVLMSNALIWLTYFVPIGAVIEERRQKTLPFVMSLPVSALDYTVAKVLFGLLVYLLPWTVYLMSLPLMASRSAVVPLGALPLVAVMLSLFLLTYVISLLVAIVSDSIWLTSGVASVLVVVAFAFGPSLPSLPRHLLEHWAGGEVVWDPEVTWTIVVLAAATLLITLGGVALGGRRRDLV